MLLTFFETESDLCKFSKRFIKSCFPSPDIKEILSRRLNEPVSSYGSYYRDDLTEGIMYRDDGSSNLSLFDWKYQDHKSKTF